MNYKINFFDTIAFVTAYVYVLFFYFISDADIETLFYSVVQVTIGTLFLIKIIYEIDFTISKGKSSLASMTLLITILYYQLSSIKYYSESIYGTFVENNLLRFIGSMLIAIVILLSLTIWKYINNKRHCYKVPYIYTFDRRVLFFLIFGLFIYQYVAYGANYVPIYFRDSPTFHTVEDQVKDLIYLSIKTLVLLGTCLAYRKNDLITKLNLILVVILIFTETIFRVSRGLLIEPSLLLLYGLVFMQKIKFYIFRGIMVLVPILMVAISSTIWLLAGRYTVITYELLTWQMGYRFDLSDFPMTLLSHMQNIFWINIDVITDGIKMAIPSTLFSGKIDESIYNAHELLYMHANMGYNIDYPDTFFSMGAEFLGIIGLICFFPFLIYIFEKLDIFISRFSKTAIIYKISLFGLFCTIETAWSEFIPHIRNSIILMLLVCVMIKIFMVKTIKIKLTN